MSVFIKGMEMPESCVLCRLECLYRIHNSTSRSEYCPLVEIKTPHGRLIDADDYFNKEYGDARAFIDNAPTVIEAEVE